MRASERSNGAALVAAGLILVPVMTISLALLSSAGIWIVVVLCGVVLSSLIAVAGVGIVGLSRSAPR